MIHGTPARLVSAFVCGALGAAVACSSYATRTLIRKIEGSYFRIWADDTGLYAGDHSHDTPGTIYRFGD